jgi:hypothetical protein
MKSPQKPNQKQKTLLAESEEGMAKVQELIRATHDLIEQSRNNLRKLEKLIKQKDKR